MPLDQSHQHSSADIIQASNPHSPISGTGLMMQMIDLGLLNFDDFDDDRYAILGAFEANTIVLSLVALPVIEWDFDTGEPLRNLSFGTAVGGTPVDTGQTLTAYPDPETNPFFAGTYAESPLFDSARDQGQQGSAVAGFVDGEGVYFASFYNGGTPLTSGQSHVYAITSQPLTSITSE